MSKVGLEAPNLIHDDDDVCVAQILLGSRNCVCVWHTKVNYIQASALKRLLGQGVRFNRSKINYSA